MNLLETWVRTPAAAALGWTLVHSLWQGAVVALALAAALRVLRSSHARYLAACTAMLVMLGGFGFTFARVKPAQALETASIRRSGSPAADSLDAGWRVAAHRVQRGAADYLPWLAPFWITGVLLFQMRSLTAWMGARRLRRTGVCAAPAAWQARLDGLGERLRLSRPVALLESCLADVPLVIGYLRPAILIPVGLLTGMPAGQIEGILLHELAHIRRRDYLVNLLQIFAEGLVFYHPAVWWISGVIRAERENCCDDMVVAIRGGAYEYAAALAALEEGRGTQRQPALAAAGGSLVKRIRRLLYQPERPRDFTPVLSAALLTVIMAGAMAAWQEPQAPVNLPANSPYNKWLKEDVAYIITDAERTAFKNLPTNDEREKFIEQFWTRRDPTPGTVENEFKEEYYRRIAYTNQHFAATALPGWKTDRGRIYITYGPPDEKESHPSGGAYRRPASEGGGATTTVPFEQWMYRWIEGVGNNVVIEFVDPKGTGEFHMTMDPSEKDAILMTLPPSEQGALPGMARTGATVQVMGNTAALVTVPLKPYSGHGAKVVGRLLSRDGKEVSAFEDNLPGSAPVYTKFVAVQPGTYRLVVLVTDAATGAWARDTLSFEVK